MLMRGKCNCRPEGQQHAQTRYPFRYRPHDGYPMKALIYTETPNKHNERVPSQVCIGHLRNANASREFETLDTADAWPILFGRTKRSLQVIQLTSVLCLLANC
jgi:hypothetical protein